MNGEPYRVCTSRDIHGGDTFQEKSLYRLELWTKSVEKNPPLEWPFFVISEATEVGDPDDGEAGATE